MNEEIFDIVLKLVTVIIIPLLGVVVTTYVVPLLKEKIGNEKFEQYKKWTELAVKTAEMIYRQSGCGKEKKEYVLNFLTEKFNSKKQIISAEQLDILIESAVKALKIEESK